MPEDDRAQNSTEQGTPAWTNAGSASAISDDDWARVLFFGLGVVLLLIGVWGLQQRISFNHNAVLGSGTITAVSHTSNLLVWDECRVNVTVDQTGSQISGKFNSNGKACASMRGREISVSYMPGDPGNATVGLKKSYGRWPVIAIGVAILIGVKSLVGAGDVSDRIYRPIEFSALMMVVAAAGFAAWLAFQNTLSDHRFNSRSVERGGTAVVIDHVATEGGAYGEVSLIDKFDCYKYIEVSEIHVHIVADTGENERDCRDGYQTVSYDPANPRDLIVGDRKSVITSIALGTLSFDIAYLSGWAAWQSAFEGRVFKEGAGTG